MLNIVIKLILFIQHRFVIAVLIHFGTVIKHVRHSFDFLLRLLSISNCRKTCSETLHVMTRCVGKFEPRSYKFVLIKKRVLTFAIPYSTVVLKNDFRTLTANKSREKENF